MISPPANLAPLGLLARLRHPPRAGALGYRIPPRWGCPLDCCLDIRWRILMAMITTANTSRFLDMHALLALEHMRFTTRHRIEGTYSGRHASRQLRGPGEFGDYREYSP